MEQLKMRLKLKVEQCLAHLTASLRLIAILLQPVMTHAPKVFTQLGLPLDNIASGSGLFCSPRKYNCC